MFLELAGYWWFEFATSWGIGLERDLEISPVLYLAPPKTTKVVNLGPPLEKNIILYLLYYIQSVQFSHSVMFHSLWPHGLQHTRLPCPSATPRAFSNSCSSSQWCHPTISSSVVPFSSCLQPFPASGSFPMSQFFTSHGPNIGFSASASVLPMNIQDQFPLGLIGWSPCCPSDSQESSPTPQFKSISSSALNFLYIILNYILGFPGGSNGKESACNAGDLGSNPWSSRSPGEGKGYSLQYSCLENSVFGGAWWATVYGVPKSQTRPSN